MSSSFCCSGTAKSGNVCKCIGLFQRDDRWWCAVHRPLETCAICYEQIVRPNMKIMTKCKHEFHKTCLDKWFKKQRTCPMCRSRPPHRLYKHHPRIFRKRRRPSSGPRLVLDGPPGAITADTVVAEPITGRYRHIELEL